MAQGARAQRLPGHHQVVGFAQEPDIFGIVGGTSQREGNDMVELQPPALGAALPAAFAIDALPSVPAPYRVSNGLRDMPLSEGPHRRRLGLAFVACGRLL